MMLALSAPRLHFFYLKSLGEIQNANRVSNFLADYRLKVICALDVKSILATTTAHHEPQLLFLPTPPRGHLLFFTAISFNGKNKVSPIRRALEICYNFLDSGYLDIMHWHFPIGFYCARTERIITNTLRTLKG